jgi:hypothetical protein
VVVDLLVVGLDLETGQEVDISDREVPDWFRKGHNGDRTLVCKHCYEGEDLRGGRRVVALVPKGRKGGKRRPYFSHPPGMAPPGGRHSPESLWHAKAKQRLRQWAEAQGAQARVEAYTDDGRRRSDVRITMPGGGCVAIEIQLGELSDTQWLARHHDYAQAQITDVWLWHGTTWVPRVMFTHRQPGWLLELDNDRIALIHAQPATASQPSHPGSGQCGEVHWPPCPGDQLGVRWMPLAAARLTPEGILPSTPTAAELARQAAIIRRTPQRDPPPGRLPAPAQTQQTPAAAASPAPRDTADDEQRLGRLLHAHDAFRYDAFPPWTDPDTWWFNCDTCGRTYTGAEIKASPIIHTVPSMGPVHPDRPATHRLHPIRRRRPIQH